MTTAATTAPGAARGRAADAESQLLVCWQHLQEGRYYAVGLLSALEGGYAFNYLLQAHKAPGFSGFPGFSEFGRRYHSAHLFPIFAERVMDPARPDRARWLQLLDLTEDARPLEILASSGGRRPGDTIELLPIPTVEDGWGSSTFLVHGIRHCAGASDRITTLVAGARLQLREDPDNRINRRALLVVVADDHTRLGWVPDPLLDHVHTLREIGDPVLTVVRANGPEVGLPPPPSRPARGQGPARIPTSVRPQAGRPQASDPHGLKAGVRRGGYQDRAVTHSILFSWAARPLVISAPVAVWDSRWGRDFSPRVTISAPRWGQVSGVPLAGGGLSEPVRPNARRRLPDLPTGPRGPRRSHYSVIIS